MTEYRWRRSVWLEIVGVIFAVLVGWATFELLYRVTATTQEAQEKGWAVHVYHHNLDGLTLNEHEVR